MNIRTSARRRRLIPMLSACALWAVCGAILWQHTASAQPLVSATALPAVLASVRAFRGQISYAAHRVGAGDAKPTAGLFRSNEGNWSVDEIAADRNLHADAQGGVLQTGGVRAAFDDAFQADALANPWMAAMGTIAGEDVAGDESGTMWTSASGLRVYLDAVANSVIGIGKSDAVAPVSATFGGWLSASRLRLPTRIVIMRDGVPRAVWQIDWYRVDWATTSGRPAAIKPVFGVQATSLYASRAARALLLGSAGAASASKMWLFFGAFAFAGLACVCWTRREGFIQRLCHRLADDPRAWRTQSESAFVSPDGTLWLDGISYNVGAQFHNRMACVQSSPLFLRISSTQVPKAVVVARKFRTPAGRGGRHHKAAFSLVEVMLATAFFALVIVGSAYPALVVLAGSGAAAQRLDAAVAAANNALIDEEAAFAYGSKPQPASKTTTVGDLRVTVDVADSAPSGLAWTADITVRSSTDKIILKTVTLLGPPVPAPVEQVKASP